MEKEAVKMNEELKGSAAEEIIRYFSDRFPGTVVFATSLGAEDQVLTGMIAGISPGMRIITLDTGRLFQETYDLIGITAGKYGVNIEVLFPDANEIEEMVNTQGVNLFYESIEKRRRCCSVRKSEPLARALRGMSAWICGLRREQSVTRDQAKAVEWDPIHNLIKVNPLIDWTTAQVWEQIRNRNIPYNTLHDRGYPSIGCLPCTRPVEPGSDLRSGRWWWESPGNRECGLHKK